MPSCKDLGNYIGLWVSMCLFRFPTVEPQLTMAEILLGDVRSTEPPWAEIWILLGDVPSQEPQLTGWDYSGRCSLDGTTAV